MISWESILSVFNTKGTLLKWLQKLEKALKDGVLLSVTVNTVSEGVITLTFNFADGSTITTPQIDIPQGAAGTIQVGTVTTGEAGTNVVIENTGTPQAAILNFTIPRGNTGEQGETGPAGPDIFKDFTSLKINTTDATVTYINGVATITNARLIGYKSGGNEEVEIAVNLPINAGENVTIGASEDNKSILISASGGGGGGTQLYCHRLQFDGDGIFYHVINNSSAPIETLQDLTNNQLYIVGRLDVDTSFYPVIGYFNGVLVYIAFTGGWTGVTGASFATKDVASGTSITDIVVQL